MIFNKHWIKKMHFLSTYKKSLHRNLPVWVWVNYAYILFMIGLCVCVFMFVHVYVHMHLTVKAVWSCSVSIPVAFCRDGKQIPNLLALFTGSESPNAQGELPRSCSVCGGERCQRQHPSAAVPLSTHAHVTCTVPQSVDEALDEVREWKLLRR